MTRSEGPQPASTPAVRAEDVSVAYQGRTVLQNVTLSIERGSITALIGPSGSGKTSFLNSLNRMTDLIPGCRVSGRVEVGEADVFGPGIDLIALRCRVGMIFQRPNPFPLSIRQNVILPIQEHGLARRREWGQRVEVVLQEVGLWDEVKDRLDAPALSLSGGQQQRLCIARALALRPEVLLLDEPCSALDPVSTGVIERLMMGLRERLTLVVVTHNLAQARRIADHAALFWTRDGVGALVENGDARQLFESPTQPETADYVRGLQG